MGKETLRMRIKDDEKEILGGIEVKSEVRKSKRLTAYNKNIASTCLDVSEAEGSHEGNKAPYSNRDRSNQNSWEEFSKGGLPDRHQINVSGSQYNPNRSRRLGSHHGDRNQNDEDNKKRSFSG